MDFLIILILLIVGVIYLYKTFFGVERWCENCNQWSVMKLDGEWFRCKTCGWKNFSQGGCPKCGWYGKYEARFVRRIGPVVEQQMFQSIVFNREWWNCPKHGEYEISVPLVGQQPYDATYSTPQYDEFDDYQWHEEPDYGEEHEDHWGPV